MCEYMTNQTTYGHSVFTHNLRSGTSSTFRIKSLPGHVDHCLICLCDSSRDSWSSMSQSAPEPCASLVEGGGCLGACSGDRPQSPARQQDFGWQIPPKQLPPWQVGTMLPIKSRPSVHVCRLSHGHTFSPCRSCLNQSSP